MKNGSTKANEQSRSDTLSAENTVQEPNGRTITRVYSTGNQTTLNHLNRTPAATGSIRVKNYENYGVTAS